MNSINLDSLEVFPWNHNFETGIHIIDEQHRKLIDLLNELAGTLVDENPIEISRVFEELAKYANYHFETEEQIWAEYFGEDSWLQSHQMTHHAFLPEVVELKDHMEKPLRDVIENIVKFLIRWLSFHIIDNDKRMALVIQNMDSGKSLAEAKIAADKKMNGSIRALIETVLTMYDGLSSRAIDLMRERKARKAYEVKLKVANKKLKTLSITDSLTGIYNRRHFNKKIAKEFRRAKRDRTQISMILFDIDAFKKFNDNYGHAQGDYALTLIGSTLKKICQRPGDYPFRLGGEEFCVLTYGQTSDKALSFADSIRATIDSLQIPHLFSKTKEYLTISGGLVTVGQLNDISENFIEQVFQQADKNLYQAKEQGRNQIVASEIQSKYKD